MSVGEDRLTEQWRRRAYAVWAVIGWCVVAAVAWWGLGKVASALIPLAMALLIVFLLRGPVAALEKRGVKRVAATALCFAAVLLVVGVVNAFIWPTVVGQAIALVKALPDAASKAYEWVRGIGLDRELYRLPEWKAIDWSDLLTRYARYLPQAGAAGAGAAGQVVAAGSQVATVIFNVVMAFVIAFWGLKDLPAIRREVFALIGPRRRDEAEMVLGEVTGVLGGYLKGQVIVSALTGLLAAVGLAFIPGVRSYAVILGLMTMALNFIPYIGPAIGAVVTTVVAAFAGEHWWYAVIAFVALFAAQQVVDLFVTPRVMSEHVDLHPVLVLLSILVFGALFGAIGILVAIPTAAIAKGLFVHYYEKHTRTELATEDGALFRSAKPEDEEAAGACGPDAAAAGPRTGDEERDG